MVKFYERPGSRPIAEDYPRLVTLPVYLRHQEFEIFLGPAKKDGIGKVNGLLRLIHPARLPMREVEVFCRPVQDLWSIT